jgi:hypothetical protein
MSKSLRCETALVLLALASLSTACSKKGPECQSLIGSINGIATSLGEAQKVTGNNDAKPEQISAALRPFAKTAAQAAESLGKTEFTVPEIKKIASETSAATLALATSAGTMADLADQMKGVEAAGKAIDEQKKLIDTNEAEIKKVCEANASLCADLAKVLVAFPPPPDKADDAKAVTEWSAKLNSWAANLLKVDIKDAALKGHVANFNGAWKTFAGAMQTLVGVTETAKKYDESTKQFNTQIDSANKATAEANAFCTK